MNFALSEEQQMLQSSANEFVKRESSLKRIRELRDDEIGFSKEIWGKMAELGWQGITIPEEFGGLGEGMVEMIVVMEELGRGLMPEPMTATVLLAGNALMIGGTEEQKTEWLNKIAGGEAFLSLAYLERQSRYDPFDVSTEAKKDGGGWSLSGEKIFVPDAGVSERIVVSARSSGQRRSREGVEMFLLDPKAKGVTLTPIPTMDWRKQFLLKLDNVAVDESERLSAGDGGEALEAALDRATVGVSAEMLGAMNAAFDMTVDYLKTRKQFGVPIGSFQALKHRAADEYVQTELSRSAVYYAAMTLDENMPDAARAVSTAKARCNDAFHLIGNESIQMHGGIGMTDEHDIGFFFKRGRVAKVTFGDSDFHRDRYARLKEY
jgi:alkylation response protein AidB-like acyl-CoA dehydrogenase